MMQEQSTADAVAAAWQALLDRGELPTIRAVNAELVKLRGCGASLRDIAPVVAELRRRAESNPRIAAVVARFLQLDPVEQREALRRMTTRNLDFGSALKRLAVARERNVFELERRLLEGMP
jgi:hypothetical protein